MSPRLARGRAALDRRDLLRASALLGGGLVIGLRWSPPALAAAGSRAPADFAPNAFVRVAPDGRVTVIVNKAEMGQGTSTGLCLILAEELDADWSRVGFEFAPVDAVYDHPGYGIQMTGGSTSIAGMSDTLRKAGAAARAMLVEAAARAWGVPTGECRTEPGAVVHAASGRRAAYGELAEGAAALEVPAEVPLKDPRDYRLVGKSTRRLDTPDKVAGRAIFGIDVRRPDMLTALIARPPVFGARATAVRSAAAEAVPGVKHVVAIDAGVAVVATGFWPAKRGRDRLEIDWDLGPNAALSTEALRQEYRERSRTPGTVARSDGDAAGALRSAARVLEADYEVPYLAHATMEPLNAVVDLRPGRCEVWTGTQFQTIDRAAAARVAGLEPEQVEIHTTYLGGGFGRRATASSDFVVEAVAIAKAVGVPVKVIWTREDDLRGGYYRPMWQSFVRAGLDGAGAITGWSHTIVGQSILAGTPFEAFLVKDGIDGTSVEGAADLPYAVPNVRVELHTTVVGVPTLWWRSVGHSHTAFVVESFLDELAHARGTDPLALRRELLSGHPRHLAALELAAEKAGWGRPAPPGRARGLALHESFGSVVAMVAEVALEQGRPRALRYTCAIDCGRAVNPDAVVAQMEGAVGFGLTAALYGEITLRDGRVEQSNFHDYRMLRVHEMPEVDVHLVPSDAPSSGAGEPGVPPVAPALGNALFALTGRRIRRLPIRTEDLAAAGGAR